MWKSGRAVFELLNVAGGVVRHVRLAIRCFFRIPNLNTCRIAFTRLFAAPGKSILRSRKTSTASVPIRLNGMSRKSFAEPGAIGSSNVPSRINRRTCWSAGQGVCSPHFREILHAQPAPCARNRGAGPATRRDFNALRRFVFRHELRRPRRAAKANLGPALRAIVNADVAVSITVFDTTGRKAAWHGGRL